MHRATNGREVARASKQLVRAPFDGVLSARYFDTGDFVSPGQALAKGQQADATGAQLVALHRCAATGIPLEVRAAHESLAPRQLHAG